MSQFLSFEKPIAELEGKIEELRHISDNGSVNIVDEISKLQSKLNRLLVQTYSRLTPWQKVQVARHPSRPHFTDYIEALAEDFTMLAGDRKTGNDKAILGGIGRFRGISCVILGHEKGATTKGRMRHNFGMASPEGYRKSVRLLDLADRFRLPVLSFIDTPGAYPGVTAEAHGQAEAIASAIDACLSIRVPLIAVVIGEGGSGGAVALATADRVLMMEHAIYSVISPEGCASILWRSAEHAETASDALGLTAQDLLQFGVIDFIIEEPAGGAHRAPEQALDSVGSALEQSLLQLLSEDQSSLRSRRQDKYLRFLNAA